MDAQIDFIYIMCYNDMCGKFCKLSTETILNTYMKNQEETKMGNTIMSINGGRNFKASMISMYQENGVAVFYVRPFSEELKADLERLMTDTYRVFQTTDISEKNGTYRIASKESLSGLDFFESFWGILFRRFSAEAKHVCLDPITEEKYYGVIFSHQYIEPCARRLAV